jgi:hypothetical protein
VTEPKQKGRAWWQRLFERQRAPLMNDAKWREVWAILVDMGLKFHFAYADSDELNYGNSDDQPGPFEANGRRILWVRVSRRVRLNSRREVENDLALVRQRLATLGEIPIAETDDYLEVRTDDGPVAEPDGTPGA